MRPLKTPRDTNSNTHKIRTEILVMGRGSQM
jgi:hypothetical protein